MGATWGMAKRSMHCTLNEGDFAGQIVGAGCSRCSHSNVLHIGVEECLACQMEAVIEDARHPDGKGVL
jgi:hypothetical protein